MTEEEARTARARAWSYILSCYKKHKAAENTRLDSCDNAAILRDKEEVSHVEQRPDRPSEIVVTPSRKGSEVES
jgi:hypothetical protein